MLGWPDFGLAWFLLVASLGSYTSFAQRAQIPSH